MASSTVASKPTTTVVKPKRVITGTTGPKLAPWAMLVYGPEGVGKSSLVLGINDHCVLDVEQSQNQLHTHKLDFDGTPPRTLQDVYDLIEFLYTGDHAYKTVVVDTIDRLEALIFKHVVEKAKRANSSIHNIEDFGYGKGYQVALDEWRTLVARLDELRLARKMNVLLIGHAFIKPFKNPDGPDYDRYTLRLNEKASGFIKEWCDAVLFARYNESTTKISDRDAKLKGVSSGERSLWTQRTAAYDAKNRFDLPEMVELNRNAALSWGELQAAMHAGLAAKKEVTL